jgi:hypothetical protein
MISHTIFVHLNVFWFSCLQFLSHQDRQKALRQKEIEKRRKLIQKQNATGAVKGGTVSANQLLNAAAREADYDRESALAESMIEENKLEHDKGK